MTDGPSLMPLLRFATASPPCTGAGVLLHTCATDIMTINGNSWALTSELAATWVSGCQSFTE